jgi:hypothetical protein
MKKKLMSIHKKTWKMKDISKTELNNKIDFNSFIKTLKPKKRTSNLSKKQNDTLYNFMIDYSTIREIQLEDKTSYTFKVIRENTSNSSFENLVVISSNNEIKNAYLIKYSPTKEIQHLENHNASTFEGNVNLIKLDLSNLNYNLKGTYCTDVWVAYCSWSYPHVAGPTCFLPQDGRISYSLETICEDDGFIEPPIDTGDGGGDSFGGGPGGDGNAVPTSPIGLSNQGEKCEKPPKGDLNGDCMLDYYEACLLNGNPQEVCDCAVVSNDLNECIDDYFDEQIFVDESFKNNTCLKSVYDKMGKASKFKEYLQNFEAEFSVAHLRFSSSTSLPSNTNAETSTPQNYLISITFNENKLDRPSLSIARTMIHEIIHAEIFRKMLSVAQHPSIQLNTNQVLQLRNDYPGLYDYYMRWKWNVPQGQTPSSPQHEAMAEHYRKIIKQALKEFDGSQPEEIYDALSWTGLMGSGTFNSNIGLYANSTKAWINIPQNQRIDILNTISLFNTNNPKCK